MWNKVLCAKAKCLCRMLNRKLINANTISLLKKIKDKNIVCKNFRIPEEPLLVPGVGYYSNANHIKLNIYSSD